MTLGNQDIIQKSINPIYAIHQYSAVGSMPNLMSGVFQVLFPGWAHSFTSCQLQVEKEH